MFEGEHASGSTESVLNFIEDQQRSVAVARLAEDLHITRRWDQRSRANRFYNNGADITFLLHEVIDISSTFQAALRAATPGTVGGIGGGTCSAPGSNGSIPRRNRASPPMEIASSEAP